MTTEQGIQRYRELFRKEHGVELSYDEAAEQAGRLLSAARIILGPMPKSWLPRYNELLKNKTKDDVKDLVRP